MLSYFAQEYGIMPSPYDSKGSEAIAPALQLVAREVGSGGGSLHQHSPQVGVGSLQAEPSCPPETMGIGRKRPLDEGTLRRFRVVVRTIFVLARRACLNIIPSRFNLAVNISRNYHSHRLICVGGFYF